VHRVRVSNDGLDDGGADDRGSASLEFILVGVMLLVPLVYLIVALGAIQEHALGAEAGARHIARVISTAPDERSARERAERVRRSIAAEYGISDADLAVTVQCRPVSAPCPRGGATVVVAVRTSVPLPLAPPVLGLDRVARVPIEASTVLKMSRQWGAP
jgi:Flp pilus assembly protein TadG